MPTKSPFPDIDIPNVDLWGFMFDRKRDFSDDQVIYRSCNSPRKYTWSEVKTAATVFGEGLRNLWDWQKGDVIALYTPNDVDIGPLIYGVFFAGGIVSPSNPGYTVDELSFQLKNSNSKAIATTKDFLQTALKAAKKANIPEDRIILLGDQRDDSHKFKHWTNIRKTSGASRYRRRKMDPDKDLAFLVYSSGTTGVPKGVMLSHRNIIADVLMIYGSVGEWYGRTDKILGVLPFFHIYGLVALVHQPLHRGIELVVMPAFNLEVFLKSIQDHKITFIYVAPPVIVRLARDPLVDKYDLSSVKMITCGAAPLTRELTEAVNKRLNIKINQAYGLSETSPMTHTQPWDEWSTYMGSIGKLFPNMIARFMSTDDTEIPPHDASSKDEPKPGEMHLSGPNVFKGYLNNQSATDSCLTKASDGTVYFKTGDVGYVDTEGNFYITDRVKELIKYKGFQVAPAELEGKLLECELVTDVAVIGVQDEERGTEVPRAYIVAASTGKDGGKKKDSRSDADEIVKWLDQRVANHKKLRGGVRFVDEIPKSAAGKILRRILKDMAKEEERKGGKKAKL